MDRKVTLSPTSLEFMIYRERCQFILLIKKLAQDLLTEEPWNALSYPGTQEARDKACADCPRVTSDSVSFHGYVAISHL